MALCLTKRTDHPDDMDELRLRRSHLSYKESSEALRIAVHSEVGRTSEADM